MVMKVGLVSDTHGFLDSATLEALSATPTSAIIHAGDVGDAKSRKSRLSATEIICSLRESTANGMVIAVAGNVDEISSDLPFAQVVTVAGVRLLVMHICGYPPKLSDDARSLINRVSPQVVVFGHSHVPGAQWHSNVLYVNPGSAGPRRFKLPRCIAFLSIHAAGLIEVEFVPVGTSPQDLQLPKAPRGNLAPRCANAVISEESSSTPEEYVEVVKVEEKAMA